MLIGYARVSTRDQNLDLQIEALRKAGCEKIYEDKISGSKTDRVGLSQALEQLREGDTFIVWKLDRLARTTKGLIDFINELSNRGVNFSSLTDNIDTSSAQGRFFFHVMSALAEMEKALIVERTQAGLAVAKAQGKVGGRKRVFTEEKVKMAKKLLEAKTPPKEVAKILGVSIPTLYRHLPANSVVEV
jgi:DNA invertase Pin-like site-specific DNA recombinase